MVKKKGFKLSLKKFDLLSFIVVALVSVYVISLIVAMANPNYKTPLEVHALIGTMVGTIIAKKVL